MNTLTNAVTYFLGFKAYVMLPIIIFIFALVFKIKIQTALKSALTIGIGFVGIFIIFDYFAKILTPVVQALVKNAGLNFNMVDLGWTPLAAMTWSFKLAPLILILAMALNVLMLVLKLTKTVDIDLWNYWHFIFASALVYETTGSILFSVISGLSIAALTFKLSDWCAPAVNKFAGMKGICTPTLSATTYFPVGVIGDKILGKVPGINKIELDPDKMIKKLGILGEPMIIGFIMAVLLGIGGGYDVKKISDLAVSFSAVVYLLPKMCDIVGTSLIPISEGMKKFIQTHFPNMGETYIGLDIAVIVGKPAIVVTAILLMPVALFLAFILPGVKFIPIADLVNIMGTVSLIVVASKGNVFRAFLSSIPVIIVSLYVASNMGELYTKLAHNVNYHIEGYNGIFTGMLDGGNFFRTWIVKIFCGNIEAMLLIPVAFVVFFITYKFTKEPSN